MDKNFKGTKEEYLEFRKKRNEANQRYYSKPEIKERKRIYKKKHDRINKEKISEYGYKLRARPETKERLKKWREENKELLRKYRQSEEYKRRKAISDRKYYEKRRKDKEKVKKDIERLRKFRENNPEKVKKYNQKYYKSPKGIINYNYHNHRRLALLKERPCDLSNKKIEKIFNRDKACVYCGSKNKLELDHIVPLKLSGNSLFNNFVLACKSCNCKKNARDVFKWCKLEGIEVPKIVLELLEKQKSRR